MNTNTNLIIFIKITYSGARAELENQIRIRSLRSAANKFRRIFIYLKIHQLTSRHRAISVTQSPQKNQKKKKRQRRINSTFC